MNNLAQELIISGLLILAVLAFLSDFFKSPLKKAEERLAQVIVLREASRELEDDDV